MLNKVILMGRLTANPELKQTQNGVSVLQFSIAVERDYKGENEERVADFFNLVAWRSTAEFISRNFTKGQFISITGTLQNEKYTDQHGNKRVSTKVIVDTAYFCGDYATRNAEQQTSQPQQQSQPQYNQMNYNPYGQTIPNANNPSYNPQQSIPFESQNDDDLPF